jgi:hypothetical protein
MAPAPPTPAAPPSGKAATCRFIESFATQQLLPPNEALGVIVNAFVFRLAPPVIQAYCDRFFNLGDPARRKFHYTAFPAAPFGMLALTQHPDISSLDPHSPTSLGWSGRQWDHLAQNELYAAVPITRYRLVDGSVLVDPIIQWMQPFTVVNNATSAFSGREVLGTETLYGDVDVGTDSSAFSAKISIPSWTVFAPNSEQTMSPFVDIQTGPVLGDTQGDAADKALADDAGTAALLQELEAAIPNLEGFVGGLFPAAMETVILKQFRDAGNPTKAVYQSLVAAQSHYANVRNVKTYDPSACVISFTGGAMVDEIISTFLDLHQLRPNDPSMIAGAGGKATRLPATMAFSFTADLEFGDITTLHDFLD